MKLINLSLTLAATFLAACSSAHGKGERLAAGRPAGPVSEAHGANLTEAKAEKARLAKELVPATVDGAHPDGALSAAGEAFNASQERIAALLLAGGEPVFDVYVKALDGMQDDPAGPSKREQTRQTFERDFRDSVNTSRTMHASAIEAIVAAQRAMAKACDFFVPGFFGEEQAVSPDGSANTVGADPAKNLGLVDACETEIERLKKVVALGAP